MYSVLEVFLFNNTSIILVQ